MTRSRLKNKYHKWPSRENYLAFKKAKNKCNSLNKKAKKKYFTDATKEGINSNKQFWDTVKPFLTNKGFSNNDKIVIEENNQFITDPKNLVKIFNNHYINIVEKTSGQSPSCLGNPLDKTKDENTVKEIIVYYKNHPSIKEIKNNALKNQGEVTLPITKTQDINKIIRSLNTKKATGPDRIPLKIVRLLLDKYNKQ